ncbi:hypothetical protein C8F01DRAFT_1253490 [Mycena amicta]|nr:hypothetical protein C8F01DRAFT_1253490 [Mycena amicta]
MVALTRTQLTLPITTEALNIEDIVQTICDFLMPPLSHVDVLWDITDLCTLVRVSREHLLSILAFRMIWSVRRSLSGIFETLPRQLFLRVGRSGTGRRKVAKIFRQANPQSTTTMKDWERGLSLLSYARTLITAEFWCDIGTFRHMLEPLLAANQCMTPNLLNLIWTFDVPNDASAFAVYFPLFIGANLQSIDIYLHDHVSQPSLLLEGLASVLSSLQRVTLSGPALWTLHWVNDIIPQFVSRLRNLQSFTQDLSGPGTRTLETLGRLAGLRELTLVKVPLAAIIAVVNEVLFPVLERLSLHNTELNAASTLLSTIPAKAHSHLRSFKLTLPRTMTAVPFSQDYMVLLDTLQAHSWQDRLEEVGINSALSPGRNSTVELRSGLPTTLEKHILSADSLSTFTRDHSSLRKLYIHAACGFALSDDIILKLAVASPHLEELELLSERLVIREQHWVEITVEQLLKRSTFTIPTVRALLHLARHCPRLYRVVLPIDWRTITEEDHQMAQTIPMNAVCRVLDIRQEIGIPTSEPVLEFLRVVAAVFPNLRNLYSGAEDADEKMYLTLMKAMANVWRQFPGKGPAERVRKGPSTVCTTEAYYDDADQEL